MTASASSGAWPFAAVSDFPPLGIRWTIGDVSVEGFDALRLSIWGAYRVFGAAARYVVCVNTVEIAEARARTGPLPPDVAWLRVGYDDLPPWILPQLDRGLAEAVAWKFAPVRVFHDAYELALDNACILWDAPAAVHEWLSPRARGGFLIAEDARRCLGRFSGLCGAEPRNSGIRGLPPHYDYEEALRETLDAAGVVLASDLDEQELHAATLERAGTPFVVSVSEVPICSPFWPYSSELGTCGAQFVGLNPHELPWRYDNRPASELTRESFRRLEPRIERILDLSPSRRGASRHLVTRASSASEDRSNSQSPGSIWSTAPTMADPPMTGMMPALKRKSAMSAQPPIAADIQSNLPSSPCGHSTW